MGGHGKKLQILKSFIGKKGKNKLKLIHILLYSFWKYLHFNWIYVMYVIKLIYKKNNTEEEERKKCKDNLGMCIQALKRMSRHSFKHAVPLDSIDFFSVLCRLSNLRPSGH